MRGTAGVSSYIWNREKISENNGVVLFLISFESEILAVLGALMYRGNNIENTATLKLFEHCSVG